MLHLLMQHSVRLLVDRRVPNTAPFSFGNTSFKVVQYNGRGVLLADQYARQLAGKNIKNLALSAHVLCLEEVHGHAQEIENILSLWLPGWRIFSSSALRADGTQTYGAGCVAIAFCPAVAAGALSFDHRSLVDGRCNSVTVQFSTDSICSINSHNYKFSSSQVRRLVHSWPRDLPSTASILLLVFRCL